MRRETFIADAPLAKDALLERFTPDPRHETRLLVCRAGQSAYAPLHEGAVRYYKEKGWLK